MRRVLSQASILIRKTASMIENFWLLFPVILAVSFGSPVVAAASERQGNIHIGAYVVNISELDSNHGTFNADFWVWSRSNHKDQFNLRDELEINYLDSKERFDKEAYYIKTLPDGDIYQSEKLRGTLLHDYDLTSFPFDHQRLRIDIEDNSRDIDQIKYTIDAPSSGVDSNIAIDGWTLNKSEIISQPHEYNTSYGDYTAPSNDSYSRARITLFIARKTPLVLVKMTLGLVIAVMLAIFSCSMPTTHAEIFSGRMLLLGSSLFAVVLNQQFVDDRIGEHTGITLIDGLHMLGMLIVLIYMLLAILSRISHETDTKHDLKKIDKYAFFSGIIFFFGIFFILIFIASRYS